MRERKNMQFKLRYVEQGIPLAEVASNIGVSNCEQQIHALVFA